LIVTLPGGLHVDFVDKLEADSYYLEMTVVWMNKECERVEAAVDVTEWVPVRGSATSFELVYEKPVCAAYYLLLVKAQGGKAEKAIEQFEAMGMRVVGVCEL
jgi:hypothetical protein